MSCQLGELIYISFQLRNWTPDHGNTEHPSSLDGGQVVEEGLELVLLDAVPDHHQLLHEEQQVGADREDVLARGPRPLGPLKSEEGGNGNDLCS